RWRCEKIPRTALAPSAVELRRGASNRSSLTFPFSAYRTRSFISASPARGQHSFQPCRFLASNHKIQHDGAATPLAALVESRAFETPGYLEHKHNSKYHVNNHLEGRNPFFDLLISFNISWMCANAIGFFLTSARATTYTKSCLTSKMAGSIRSFQLL